MDDKYMELFSAYNYIMKFSLEEEKEKSSKYHYADLRSNLESVFFNQEDGIYVSRKKKELEIKRNILFQREKLLSVEGVEGCGKSTIVKKTLNENCKKDNYEIIIFDFRHLREKEEFLNSNIEAWTREIYNLLKTELMDRFLYDSPNYEILFDMALFFEDPKGKDKKWRNDFQRQRFELRHRYEQHLFEEEKQKIEDISINKTKMKEWYKKNKFCGEIEKIRTEILEKLKYFHILRLLPFLENYKNIILLFDNVDAIDFTQQHFAFDIAVTLNRLFQEFLKVIITIRYETANHHPAYRDNRTDIEHCGIVGFNKAKERYFLKASELYSILLKRQNYFNKKYSENVDFINLIGKLTRNLRRIYSQNLLIDISNQSITEALKNHTEFLNYVVDIITSNKEEYQNLEKIYLPSFRTKLEKNELQYISFLSSCFLGWIADNNEWVEIKFPNIVRSCISYIKKSYHETKSDIKYLIITNLLTKKAIEKLYNRVFLRNVLDDFNFIGYNEDEIKENIYNMYLGFDNTFGYIVNIYSTKRIESFDQLTDDVELLLNFRGTVLGVKITNSFTFINKLLYKEENLVKDIEKFEITKNYFNFKNYKTHIKNNLKFYGTIANIHTLELLTICKNLYKKYQIEKKEGWLKEYRKRFCYRNKLQLERIIKKSIKFMDKMKVFMEGDEDFFDYYITTYKVLSSIFREHVENLTHDAEKVYDFKKIAKEIIKNEKSGLLHKGNINEFKDSLIKDDKEILVSAILKKM